MMCEWWKQLYGESEGKDNKGLFPASVVFSTDLHSMGQYIQQGRRSLFETVVLFDKAKARVVHRQRSRKCGRPEFPGRQEPCPMSTRRPLREPYWRTPTAACRISSSMFRISRRNPWAALIYFFEKACAVSGYLLGVNPFDQPGVESYKKNMFALLGKPGYEELRRKLLRQDSTNNSGDFIRNAEILSYRGSFKWLL